ncbi:cytochrome P450 [[Mycobacterium] appelbergii]|uniref:cytochrome P450 n=1 Tax=[Mycobacterium] appelbergii TaxID=2939269 RepID=UPI002939535C|nr:cytochrome P450 [Mycobacterium sp. 21AC1]
METNTDTVFARLRREAPLAYIPAIGAWVASTWELCMQIPSSDGFVGGTSLVHERVFGVPHVGLTDGEQHKRLRAAIDPPLRPRGFAGRLEEQIRPLAKAQIEKIREQGSAELMADYFEPVSVRSVGDVLGFTETDDVTLRRWFHQLSSGIANLAMDENGNFANPSGFIAADTAKAEIRSMVEGLARRPAAEVTGIVAHWLYAEDRPGQAGDLAELYPTLHVLLLGGLQEPGHACGSTFLGLNTQPDLLERVAKDKSLIGAAINEGLRWISPLYSGSSRRPPQDCVLAGQDVKAYDTVWLAYGSANRDESEFPSSEIYDIDRQAHRHLAFGRGRHTCSGAAFAPQVARIAMEELFGNFPGIRLDPVHEPEVRGWIFRGPRELRAIW